MAEIGIIGMGKLGLPVALAIESRGHGVHAFDVSAAPYNYIEASYIPYQEAGLQPLLDESKITMHQSVGHVVANSEIIFVAVQTPHEPKFEGITRLPKERADFDYTYFKEAIRVVADTCAAQKVGRTIVGISTCLPGTFSREIEPLLNEYTDYGYSPQFIAMGTVLEDYLHPEFNLIGVLSKDAAKRLETFYATINDAPNVVTDITTAEGIKVSYNTWITAKTVIANAWGEMAHKTGMNFDDIKRAWDLSDKRIHSPKYTAAGSGDGGGCHPRDNIAMSWLADQVGTSHNIWEDLMEAREDHMAWIAEVGVKTAQENGQTLVVLGRSFKPETNIETGSAAVLLANIIQSEHGQPVLHVEDIELKNACTVIIGTAHERYRDYKFPTGSTVVDPFGVIKDQEGVNVIRLGRK